uniref:GTP pyrophosphokinase n=1 Tax=Acetatifactor sp. TaxID=1872090 RepID=UPI004057B926
MEQLIQQAQRQFLRDNFMSDEFLDFMQKNRLPFETMSAYYRCAMMEIETKFKVLNEQFSLQYDRNPIETIKTRMKSMDSILKKVRTKDIPLTFEALEENIRDIAGVRVICSFQDDIYMLAECLLQQDDVTLIERKDYIKNPKPSGYRSLHLIVEIPIFLQNEKRPMKVEVQLRTIAMDFWASLEHKLRYKKNIPDKEAEILARELVECAETSAALDRRMQDIRTRIAKSEELHKEKDTEKGSLLQMLGMM